ncbi:hypothetical protein Gohar_025426 [Gossypium harknessii]|uniref:Uncharacterized protein n=1 Tax=Gossypium harknessii TaxID=34285 RepID=A0A7J9HIY3_9ROSI|nr:hypothetical protein [Gossypium harknessii]
MFRVFRSWLDQMHQVRST